MLEVPSFGRGVRSSGWLALGMTAELCHAGILRRYLPVFAVKTGSTAGEVVYLDGYARPGLYDDGSDGAADRRPGRHANATDWAAYSIPMIEELAVLGQRLRELADATEATKGEMTLPGIDITAAANQEAKNDAAWGNPATFETPVQSALAHLELLFHAANDHLRSLGTLLSGEHISWFGHIAVARAVVETSSRLWYLAEPNIGALERVRRHLLEIQHEYGQRGAMLGQHFTELPAPLLTQASRV